MRQIKATTLALLVVLGGCLQAFAQFEALLDPSDSITSIAIRDLLSAPEVQKELGLTETQNRDLNRLNEERRAFSRSLPRVFDLQDLSKEDREKRGRELKESNEKAAKGMLALLDDSQKTRLTQLRLQQLGSSALNRPDVTTALKLTEEQVAQIKQTITAHFKEESQILANRQKAASEASVRQSTEDRNETLSHREKLNAGLFAILTTDQRTQWDGLQGKKFEIPGRFGSRVVPESVTPSDPNEMALSPARAALLLDAITMLDHVEVWKELKVTDAQNNTLTMLLAEKKKASAVLYQPEVRQGLNKEEIQKLDNQFQAVVMKTASQMLQVFDDRQIERLEQLKLQKEGPRSLLREDIAGRLKLSKEQHTELRRVQFDASEQQRKLLDEQRNAGGPRKNPLQFSDKLREIQEKANADYLKILTDEQKADFESLMGPKFEIPDPSKRFREQLRNAGKSKAA